MLNRLAFSLGLTNGLAGEKPEPYKTVRGIPMTTTYNLGVEQGANLKTSKHQDATSWMRQA